MIKILQVNKLYYPVVGGVEQVVRQLAEGLKDRTDTKVLVCRNKGRTLNETINGVDVCRASSLGIAFSMPVSLSFFYHFKKMARSCDILHIHMPFPLADIAASLFKFRGKIVLWWHSDIVRQKFFLSLYKPFMHQLLKRADAIVAATQGHIDNSDFLPEYRHKCVVIPFGVKANPITAQTQPPKQNEVVVLFVGRLVYYKGCEFLIDAFSRIAGARLRIVGSGPLEGKLKKMSEKFSDKVDFLGNLSDEEVSQEFANCDIFVLPSIMKTEAFGLVQIEAMSCGKPVINTYIPSGAPYVSLNGITGITVRPSDAKALAEAIQKLVDDEQLRLEYGKNASARVLEEFTEEVMLGRVLELYNNILNKPRGIDFT
ncbi:MAG: glycosyltransferase [Oscillospiraceae bacterium]|nr:glycosyltransferase [Oscillospiraceae bacterium]